MSRRAGAVAKSLARATRSEYSKLIDGRDELEPMEQAGDRCFWCGEKRKTRLRVGRLVGIGYGTYCVACGRDGAGKQGLNEDLDT